MPFSIDFATLEGLLAAVNYIANDKRTAFQARLKNFHRLGFPADLEKTKGKPTSYSIGHVFEMAMAVECTQLGLAPERAIQILTDSRFATAYAAGAAVATLREHPEGFPDLDPENASMTADIPTSHFLLFDPFALRGLTSGEFAKHHDWFAYVSDADINKTISVATVGGTSRAAVINITALIDRLALPIEDWKAERAAVLDELQDWAVAVADGILQAKQDGNP